MLTKKSIIKVGGCSKPAREMSLCSRFYSQYGGNCNNKHENRLKWRGKEVVM